MTGVKNPIRHPHLREDGLGGEGGGGFLFLLISRLMGMCCWMGLYFHDWKDYYEVAYFQDFGVRKLRSVKKKDLHHIKFNKYTSSFQDDLVKRLYKVDA